MILFSARYNELINGGAQGNRWVSVTQSIHKRTGKVVYDPPERGSFVGGAAPHFQGLVIDSKAGTITLVGLNGGGSVQHYVDDGRKQTADVRVMPPFAGIAGQAGPQPPVPANLALQQARFIERAVRLQAVPVPQVPPPPPPKRD